MAYLGGCHLHGIDAEASVEILTQNVGETCVELFLSSLLAQFVGAE